MMPTAWHGLSPLLLPSKPADNEHKKICLVTTSTTTTSSNLFNKTHIVCFDGKYFNRFAESSSSSKLVMCHHYGHSKE